MRTSNPALNEKAFERAVPASHLQSGWAAPTTLAPAPDTISEWTPAAPPPGAVTADDTMTIGGSISATAVLLVLLCAAGFVGWNAVEISPFTVELPGWMIPAFIVGL